MSIVILEPPLIPFIIHKECEIQGISKKVKKSFKKYLTIYKISDIIPPMTNNTHINRASSTKATEATITNLNLGVTLERNDVYEICTAGDNSNHYNMGYLYHPLCEAHFEEVACRAEFRAKRLCEVLKGGLHIGANPKRGDDLYDYNPSYFRKLARDRKLFLEFLNRYMAGEFKYHFPGHSKPRYFHEVFFPKQSSIKLLTDTISEICKPKRRRKINN